MRVLFYAINGIGVGHLSRLIGIAEGIKHIDSFCHCLFLTEVADTRFIRFHNMPFFQLPPSHSIDEDVQWEGIRDESMLALNNALEGTIKGYRPDLVIYDSLVPKVVINTVNLLSPKPKQVYILRKRNNLNIFFNSQYDDFLVVDNIIFPHDISEIPINDIPSEFVKKCFFQDQLLEETLKI